MSLPRSISALPLRSSQRLCTQCLCTLQPQHSRTNNSTRTISIMTNSIVRTRKPPSQQPTFSALRLHSSAQQPQILQTSSKRTYVTKTPTDTILEDLQDQYATARDEFEIATEETEKKTVYAADDRAAAREELEKLKEMYEHALTGDGGDEVKRRVGQRVRELENAVKGLEESALED